ncbi:MAG TPA: peptide deformylase [Bacteroidetes bacterium]|nr:peptide deformylase [Bacteroidota bacterium]
MILPIVAYGNAVLKQKAAVVDPDMEGLDELLHNMWETMYNGRGVGLAAPQIGKSLRIFMVDTEQLVKENEEAEEGDELYRIKTGIKQVFINPEVISESGNPWVYEEGCLSIPDIRAKISRNEEIRIKYQNERFESFEATFDGMNARVIQHEYDHLEGILLTDRMSPLKKSLLKGKLDSISKGRIDVNYRMRFVQ